MYLPAFGNPEADLIAEWEGKLIRIQVKTLAGDDDFLRFTVLTSTARKYIGVADWLALHSLHYGSTAFLKPEEAGARPTIRYIEAARDQANIRYVQDYPLERVIKELSV